MTDSGGLSFRSITWMGEDIDIDMDLDVDGKTSSATYTGGGGGGGGGASYRVTAYGKVGARPVRVRVLHRPSFCLEVGICAPRHEVEHMLSAMKKGLRDRAPEYVGAGFEKGRSFLGYAGADSSGFCRLTFKTARCLRWASRWLAQNRPRVKQYEATVDPLVGFLLANDIRPCGTQVLSTYDTDCTVVVDTTTAVCLDYAGRCPFSVESTPSRREDEVVVASFDIECRSSSGAFPDPCQKEDAIIVISTVFSRLGEESPFRRLALALGEVDKGEDDDGIDLLCFDTEAELLRAWAVSIAEHEVDVLSGYNIWGFDMRYIHQRVLINGGVLNPHLVDFYALLGNKERRSRHDTREDEDEDEDEDVDFSERLRIMSVKGGGAQTHEAAVLDTPGVLQLDMYYYLRRFHASLRFFKLDQVAKTLLGGDEGKTGLGIGEMQTIWRRGTPVEKWEVVRYCTQDAILVDRLMHKVTALNTVFEMANVCSVPPSVILMQGEQAKVQSLILGYTARRNMYCPTPTPRPLQDGHHREGSVMASNTKSKCTAKGTAIGKGKGKVDVGTSASGQLFSTPRPRVESDGDDCAEDDTDGVRDTNLKGAIVLEPRRGAYWRPIVCLDFQSLYPSIMMAHNLCHSTFVRPEDREKTEHIGIATTDVAGLRVVRPEVQRGVLPMLLEDLQVKRNEAKAEMARTDDAYHKAVMNAKQVAYKVSMNAVYGFCGVSESAGLLPCMEVAGAITAVGRRMIERTKSFVEDSNNAVVVYGDTDSLMIDFGVDTVEEASELGMIAARNATALFPSPIKLCFEKCYLPFLLFSKKRYVGRVVQAKGGGGLVDSKGVQYVRRDACAFVRNTCSKAVDILLHDMDVDGAVEYVRGAVRRLLSTSGSASATDPVSVEDLVSSKTIKACARDIVCDIDGICTRCGGRTCGGDEGYGESNVVHGPRGVKRKAQRRCLSCGFTREVAYENTRSPAIQVACKTERVRPGSGPRAGDTVRFVFVKRNGNTSSNNRNKNCSEFAEDPSDVTTRGLTPDYRFYYDNHLKNILTEMFGLVLEKSRVDTESQLFGDIVREFDRNANRQTSMMDYYLFTGNGEDDKKKRIV